MEVIKLITRAMGNILSSYFVSDIDVMSKEAKRIFSNTEDKKKYIEAVEKLRKTPGKEEKIVLSTKEELILVS